MSTDRGGALIAAQPRGSWRVSFWRAVRGEWIKLMSQRVVLAGLLVAALVIFFLGVGAASGAERAVDIDALIERGRRIYAIVSGLPTACLVSLLVGVASIGNEYGTGLIRVTLTVLPRRGMAFSARAAALAAAALLTSLASFAATAVVTGGILAAKGYDLALDVPTLAAFAGAVVSMPLVALLRLGFGAIARSTAAGIIVALVVFLGLPFALDAAAAAFQTTGPANLSQILPSVNLPWQMGVVSDLLGDLPQVDSMGRLNLFGWQAWVLLVTWTALSLGCASALFRRRSA